MDIRQISPLTVQDLLPAVQAGLMVAGFWFAIRILQQRLPGLSINKRSTQLIIKAGMLFMLCCVTVFNLWLLMQPMVMRMCLYPV
jgi:hypothetical protein